MSVPDGPGPSLRRSVAIVWRTLRSMRTAIILLLMLAAASVVGSLVPQLPNSPARAAQFLAQVAPVLPGLGAVWNGRATIDFWPGNPFSRGSYSFWQVGQYTRFAGIEGTQDGNAHFCGEHTSIDAQGYLEGAVETAERAADEVNADLNG